MRGGRLAASESWAEALGWPQGRDHLFVFAGARGPNIFRDWKLHIRRSVFLTPEGDRAMSEQFNTWKDVVRFHFSLFPSAHALSLC